MPTERPKELDIAFWAIIAAGVLSVIGAVFGFDADMIRQQLATVPELDQQLQATGMSIDAFLSALHTMVIVFSVISLAIYVLLAFMIRKGSNVARIFATVFAALSVFGLFGGTFWASCPSWQASSASSSPGCVPPAPTSPPDARPAQQATAKKHSRQRVLECGETRVREPSVG